SEPSSPSKGIIGTTPYGIRRPTSARTTIRSTARVRRNVAWRTAPCRWDGAAARSLSRRTRGFVEIRREQSAQPIEPLQLHVPALEEVDVGITYELAHHAGYEYLAAERLAGDARRIVDGRAEEIVGFVQGIAGVNADSNVDRRRTGRKCPSDLPLDR